MLCDECDQLLQAFQQAVLDFISQVHYLHWLTEVEHFPHQYEKERQQERNLETAILKTMEELNNHRRTHTPSESKRDKLPLIGRAKAKKEGLAGTSKHQ
jgi:hypothetical protein